MEEKDAQTTESRFWLGIWLVLATVQRRRKTAAQWSKVLFSDESKFCISFGNQGPRVWRKGGEDHSPSCLKC